MPILTLEEEKALRQQYCDPASPVPFWRKEEQIGKLFDTLDAVRKERDALLVVLMHLSED